MSGLGDATYWMDIRRGYFIVVVLVVLTILKLTCCPTGQLAKLLLRIVHARGYSCTKIIS